MKYTTALFALAALLATTTLASPSPSPAADALLPRWSFCKWRGQGCSSKLRRAVDAASAELHTTDSEALVDTFLDHYCSLPDKPCYAAKSSAEALAGALAEAHAFSNPEKRWAYNFCKWRGQGCSSKMKRAADTILAEFGEGEAELSNADVSTEEREAAEKFKAIAERLKTAAAGYQAY